MLPSLLHTRSAKETMTMEVGASQSSTKSTTTQVSYGQTIQFTVPAGKTYEVQYIFEKGRGQVPWTGHARASGYFFFKAGYGGEPGEHVYPWNIDEVSPLTGSQPMPDNLKAWDISGLYSEVEYTRGSYKVFESGRDITADVVRQKVSV
jgi:hypothetical protein